MPKGVQTPPWHNRLVGEALVDPTTLVPHPHNWRVHPGRQAQAMRTALEQVGWVQRVLVSQRSGLLLDGHLRVQLALEHHEPAIPVTYVDVTPDEEHVILATFDPLAALAEQDASALAALLATLGPETTAALALAQAVHAPHEPLTWDPTTPLPESAPADDLNEIVALRNDALFSSTNPYGIPDLLPERLATTWPQHVYGSGACTTPHDTTLFLYRSSLPADLRAGFLGFFIDDARFEVVWRDAVRFVERLRCHPWTAILAPDFSLWHEVPAAVQLYNIFRRQWCARYWQAAGFEVIPLINAMGGLGQRSIDYALMGIPPRPPVVALQVRTGTTTAAGRRELARLNGAVIEGLRPGHCVIYGGLEHAGWLTGALPAGCEYTYLPGRTQVMRQGMARQKERAHAT